MEIVLLLVAGSSLWMAIDSSHLGGYRSGASGVAGTHPLMWFLAGVLLWIVAFPVYLSARPRMMVAARNSVTEPRSSPSMTAPTAVATTPAPLMPPGLHGVDGRRPCPHCAEDVRQAAIVCRYCAREIPARVIAGPRAVSETRPPRRLWPFAWLLGPLLAITTVSQGIFVYLTNALLLALPLGIVGYIMNRRMPSLDS